MEVIRTKAHMSKDPVKQYVVEHSVKHRLHPAQTKLIEVTLQQPGFGMLGSSDALLLLSNLVKHMGFKKTLDIGVYTGYSALSIALALPEDGRIVACDVSEEYPNIGKKYWKEAGVESKIDLRIAPAEETLQSLIGNGESSTFDFAFIDANKDGYDSYYELALKLLRKGGLIAIDNVLWSGRVADPSNTEPSTVAIRAVNDKIAVDDRVDMSMIQVGDGITLAFKK